ncbi:MAG: hypothetical protein M3461_12490 [Pseudomonadota bacterium]|nr:hypothetical protein [Pseudomonadota bacterium]
MRKRHATTRHVIAGFPFLSEMKEEGLAVRGGTINGVSDKVNISTGVGFYIFRYTWPKSTGHPHSGSTKELQASLAMAGRAMDVGRPQAIFVGLGLCSGDILRDPAFALNCFLTRSVYLVIAAVMLGYLSTYEREVGIALGARRSERGPWRSLAIRR